MMESNSKLEVARRLRGWTLEVASQKIGVHPRTLRRWETGKSKPYGFRIYKISEVYEMTPRALGIGAERHQWYIPNSTTLHCDEEMLRTRVVEPLMTIEDLDLHLMGLILQRKLDRQNLDYQPFQLQIHQCINAYDKSLQKLHVSPPADPVRVQALRVVASIPIAAYLENATQRSLLAPPAEILTHCASAITACWHMDLSRDLNLARTFVSGYIILLSEIFAHFDHCRHASAELIAQACLLRTMLAIQHEGTHASVSYYTRALEFSQIADSAGTALGLPIHAHALYGYGRQPAQTLEKMAEALWLLKPTPPPPDFPLVRDYLQKVVSLYQMPRPDEQVHINLATDEQAETFRFPGTIDYAETALNLWDGLAYHELGEYAQALDNSNASNPEESVCDAPEQVRGEFLQNRALASLRLHDMDQGITTLRAVIPQALSMGNEQELVEAREAYHMMQFLSPGEPTTPANELKDLLKKHD
jgi:transcriptional regulator with XRE-family HTH domain